MSRAKVRGFKKMPVERTLVSPEVRKKVRKVLLNPETNKYEVKHIETVIPAVYRQGRAKGPTTSKGAQNKPENMAPKGKGGAKPMAGAR